MLDIVIATRNRHKFRELTSLLALPHIRWHSLTEFPSVAAADESGGTFDANAIQKAQAVARATGHLALADDSGLEVEALGWGPGVRSARFAGRHGDDRANNAKLLRLLARIPRHKRRARYRCSLALTDGAQAIVVTRGVWNGRIALSPRGRRGFGYDPVFLVPRVGKTVGQLPASMKRRLSHRAHAARRLRPALRRLARLTGQIRGAVGGSRRRPARAV
ncbi:MAG: RdgB/HAM1 family non-canonical purine NTP pyrophosphatase [Candidatus Omnitrophica bacterium]|nr:RdgB/HAM1 family non-canonical purine NTP pyrophosphatase [Candidatus Omnitrophota bacterium]